MTDHTIRAFDTDLQEIASNFALMGLGPRFRHCSGNALIRSWIGAR